MNSNGAAAVKFHYVNAKVRKQNDKYILLVPCPCGSIHEFTAGTKEALTIAGLHKAKCGNSLFTTLDDTDRESNAHVFEVLQHQGKRWRHRKAVRGIKRRVKLLEALKQHERDFLIERHNAAIKALKSSPGLLESMRAMETELPKDDE